MDVIYCDLMKAFDTLPHFRLLEKVTSYGIGGQIHKLDTKSRVAVNREVSNWKEVSSGVPQGSVLGAVLLVLYVNNLPESVIYDSVIYLDANDTKLYRK